MVLSIALHEDEGAQEREEEGREEESLTPALLAIMSAISVLAS